MLVYSRASKASIDRAVAKAKAIKPRAKILGYGRFSVAGSKDGQRYEVTFGANSQGELVVDCTCTAGKNGNVCYHSASCSGLYKGQWTERHRTAPAPATPPVCSECEIYPAQPQSDLCEQCISWADECRFDWAIE